MLHDSLSGFSILKIIYESFSDLNEQVRVSGSCSSLELCWYQNSSCTSFQFYRVFFKTLSLPQNAVLATYTENQSHLRSFDFRLVGNGRIHWFTGFTQCLQKSLWTLKNTLGTILLHYSLRWASEPFIPNLLQKSKLFLRYLWGRYYFLIIKNL